MKWLIDAQLPATLARRINQFDHEALHTLDLPRGNRSTDQEIIRRADDDGRIVVTKDRDFLDAHLLTNSPGKLLWINTGNISNPDLLSRFEQLLPNLEKAFQTVNCIELTATQLIFYH